MKIEELNNLAVPVCKKVDVLVVGGGTAGSVAAIAAARSGAETVLTEDLGFLGGTQTAALVTPQMPNLMDQKPLNTGINCEINSRMAAIGAAATYSDGNTGWFDPEMLKYVLDDMVAESGAVVRLFTRFEDVILSGSEAVGAVFCSKQGRQAVLAKRIIDCSGDGDVAYRAGAQFESGDSLKSTNQPMSVRFNLANVDTARLIHFLEGLGPIDKHPIKKRTTHPLIHTAMVWGGGWPLEPVFRTAVNDGILNESDGNYFQLFSVPGRPWELAFNCPRIPEKTAGTNVDDLSDAMRLGRQAIRRYLEFCRHFLPGCKDSYISVSATMAGIRETRRIKGLYQLTADDVLNGQKFEDAVARCNYPIDIHRDPGQEGGGLTHLRTREYYEIPYRCLVPAGIENLLIAGRCLSASFQAQASARIQPVCRALGQAAGVAAALSLKHDTSPAGLDGVMVRRELAASGANL
jgi:hypothetical protein